MINFSKKRIIQGRREIIDKFIEEKLAAEYEKQKRQRLKEKEREIVV